MPSNSTFPNLQFYDFQLSLVPAGPKYLVRFVRSFNKPVVLVKRNGHKLKTMFTTTLNNKIVCSNFSYDGSNIVIEPNSIFKAVIKNGLSNKKLPKLFQFISKMARFIRKNY